jgi:hypothetical protein
MAFLISVQNPAFPAGSDSIQSNYLPWGIAPGKCWGSQLHLRVVFSTVQGRLWKNTAGKDAIPPSGTQCAGGHRSGKVIQKGRLETL